MVSATPRIEGMMVPTIVSATTMNIANWEREASMNSRNADDSSEDEFVRVSQNVPWHALQRLEDSNLQYSYRFFDHSQPAIQEYDSMQQNIAAAISTPGSTHTPDLSGLQFPSFSHDEQRSVGEHVTNDDGKPAACKNPEEVKEAPFHRHRHGYMYRHYDQDQYVDYSKAFDEGGEGGFRQYAGYNTAENYDTHESSRHQFAAPAAEDYSIHESSRFPYAPQAPFYAPPQHIHLPHGPRLNFPFQDHFEEAHDSKIPPSFVALSAQHSPVTSEHSEQLIRRKPSSIELDQAPTPRARRAIQTWYERFNELMEYKEAHGDCNVPQKYKPSKQLGIWVNKQRMEKKAFDKGEKTSMTEERKSMLNAIGFVWAKLKGEHSWREKYNELRLYKTQVGNCDVATKYGPNPALGRWVSTQRSEYKKFNDGVSKHLTQQKIDALNLIGFKWEMLPSRGEGGADED